MKPNGHIKNLFTAAIVAGALMNFSYGQTKRKSSLPANLLNKVLKKDRQIKEGAFDSNILNSRFASWGVNPTNKASINLEGAWKNFSQKKEMVVAVIDTGIDPNHPFLQSNLYTPSGKASSNNFGIDFSKNRSAQAKPFDSHGHGTHVSGIIKSVHPGVKILTLKYYNPKASGQDNLNSTIEALRYAVSQNVDIINYSGGGPEPALEELRILKEAERKGIIVVAAAGNEESNIDIKSKAYYPASYGLSNIITVTAHDQTMRMLTSSNFGKHSVDISAPGYRIKSALPNGRSGYLTGTSQATAFVTGVVALMKSKYPNLNAKTIKKIVRMSAKKEISLLDKCISGGRLDADKALKLADRVINKNAKRSLANRSKTKKNQGKIYYRRKAN